MLVTTIGGLALRSLLALDLEPLTLTLVVGDFNTHSPRWSCPGMDRNPTSDRIEDWAAGQGLELLTQPGIPTRQGENGQRDTVLDLVLCNFAATHQGTFHGAMVDWSGSLGSNHTLIPVLATSKYDARPPTKNVPTPSTSTSTRRPGSSGRKRSKHMPQFLPVPPPRLSR